MEKMKWRYSRLTLFVNVEWNEIDFNWKAFILFICILILSHKNVKICWIKFLLKRFHQFVINENQENDIWAKKIFTRTNSPKMMKTKFVPRKFFFVEMPQCSQYQKNWYTNHWNYILFLDYFPILFCFFLKHRYSHKSLCLYQTCMLYWFTDSNTLLLCCRGKTFTPSIWFSFYFFFFSLFVLAFIVIKLHFRESLFHLK